MGNFDRDWRGSITYRHSMPLYFNLPVLEYSRSWHWFTSDAEGHWPPPPDDQSYTKVLLLSDDDSTRLFPCCLVTISYTC